MLAVIGLFAVANIVSNFTSPSLQRNRLWRRSQAVLRYVAYRGFRIRRVGWYSPSLGYLLVALAGAIFFFGQSSCNEEASSPKLTPHSNDVWPQAILLANHRGRLVWILTAHRNKDRLDGRCSAPIRRV